MKIALILNLLITAAEVYAFLSLLHREGKKILIYYTTLSNLYAMLTSALYSCCALSVLKGAAAQLWPPAAMLRYSAVIGLTITFLVVVLVLSRYPTLGGRKHLLLDEEMLFTHFLCPVVSMISFLFFEDTSGFGSDAVWIGLIPTFLYTAVSIYQNIRRRWDGPYPFLKVHENGVKKSVLWAAGLLSFFVLLAWLLLQLNRLFT